MEGGEYGRILLLNIHGNKQLFNILSTFSILKNVTIVKGKVPILPSFFFFFSCSVFNNNLARYKILG